MDAQVSFLGLCNRETPLICVRLPQTMTYDDGALLEPLAVACHAVRRAGVTSASTCLIMGAGAVGLLCAAVARSNGCSCIAICDIDKRRVDFAVKEGFAEVGWSSTPTRGADINEDLANARKLAEQIGTQVWPMGDNVGKLQVTFECTGVPSCVQTSIYVRISSGIHKWLLTPLPGYKIRRASDVGRYGHAQIHAAHIRMFK